MSEEEQIILPSGFKRVEYLQSSGTQWIQTDYCPSNETKIVSDFYFIKAGKNGRFCGNGATYGGGTNIFTLFLSAYGTGAIIFDFGTVRKDKNNYNLSVGRHTISADKNGIVIDGTVALTTNNTEEFQSTHPMSIFTGGGEASQDSDYWRIYNFIIYENDEVVRHFIPCLNENDEPCMYDVINKKAYTNAGTGEFYYPRNYHSPNYNLPSGFKKCVYLQSDGTQWINTQVVPNDETGLYLRALRLNYGPYVSFGVNEGGNEMYPPRFDNSNLYFRWGTTSTKMMTWDKAGDFNFSSYLNFYNSKFAYFNSDDTDVESYITSQIGTFTIPIWLFTYNYNGSYNATYGKWGGRIYRAQITQGDSLIRDFVPCLDADNRPCMYDLITQEAYYNQSGGAEFSYCVEHELPSDFVKLKYLESDGTQFIKTGYVPTNTTGMYIDAYNTVGGDFAPMGCRNDTGNTRFFIARVTKTNAAGYGWGSWVSPGGTGDCRYDATLNWLNDRKSIINAPAFAQRVNSLGTLSFTPLYGINLFGVNQNGSNVISWKGRIYRAKISEGTEIVRDFVPAMDNRNSKPCMYDLINNVAYYNDGTGEFIYNRDFEGTYKGFGVLGGIGNKLGSDYIFGDFIEVDFIEHDTPHKYMIDLLTRKEPYDTATIGFYVECAYVDTTLKSGPISIWGFNGTMGTWFIKPLEKTRDYDDSVSGNYYVKNAYLGVIPVGTKLRGEMNFLMNKVHWVKGGDYHYKISLENYEIESLTSGVYSYGILNPYCKLYKLKISQGKHITRDFIPVINNQGVPTLYDKIKNELFTPDVKNAIAGLNSITKALRLKLPENGGSIKLSIPREQTSSSHEEKIRANNPNWEITFYYH